MILTGRFKSDRGRLAGQPYTIDLGLDSIYVKISSGDPVYSDYVTLQDRAPFKNLYAIVDFDKNNRVVGFTVEGMMEQAKASSLRAWLEMNFGVFALRHQSAAVREAVVQYLQDHLAPLLDSKGNLVVTTAHA